MRIRRIVHKRLRRFVERDDPSGLPPAFVEKIRNILSFLQEMEDVDELLTIPGWRAHRMAGRRKDIWSLTVARNWRITFGIDEEEFEIVDLDSEDCD